MSELDLAKIAFADAIIEEAAFNGIEIDLLEDEIEHQLGTVWVGNKASIQSVDCKYNEEEK